MDKEKIRTLIDHCLEVAIYIIAVGIFVALALMPAKLIFGFNLVPSAYADTIESYTGHGTSLQSITSGDHVYNKFSVISSGSVSEVRLWLKGNGSARDVTVKIMNYDSGSNAPNTVYGTSNAVSVGLTEQEYTFSFSSPVSVSPGDYMIQIEHSGDQTTSIYGAIPGGSSYCYKTSYSGSGCAWGGAGTAYYYIIGSLAPDYAISNYNPADNAQGYYWQFENLVFNATTSYDYTGSDWYIFSSYLDDDLNATSSSRGSTTGLQVSHAQPSDLLPGTHTYYGTIKDKDNVLVATSTITDFTVEPSILFVNPYNNVSLSSDFSNWLYELNTNAYSSTGTQRYTVITEYQMDGGVGLFTDTFQTIGGQGQFSAPKSIGLLPGHWFNATTTLYDASSTLLDSDSIYFGIQPGTSPVVPDDIVATSTFEVDCSGYDMWANIELFGAELPVPWPTDDFIPGLSCYGKKTLYAFGGFLFEPFSGVTEIYNAQLVALWHSFPFSIFTTFSDVVVEEATGYVEDPMEITIDLPVFDIPVTLNPTDFVVDNLGSENAALWDEYNGRIFDILTVMILVEMFFVFFL